MNFGEDFFWVPQTEEISGIQVRCGIWVFRKFKNGDEFYLQGLSPTGINELLSAAKFYKLPDNPDIIVREVDSIIEVQSISEIKEFLKEYLNKIPEQGISLEGVSGHASKLALQEKYYRQYNMVVNKNYLEHLNDLPKTVLHDDFDVSFIPFENVIVQITSSGIELVPYKDLKNFVVWKNHIISRHFNGLSEYTSSHFYRFLMNVSNQSTQRYNALISAMGYLMHNFNSPSKGQSVLLYDEDITNIRKPQGGTGKGIITQALKQVRNVAKVDGKNYKSEDRFKFQQVDPDTHIVCIDDPKPNFDFPDLFSGLTDGLTIEKKHQKSFLFSPEKSPKFIIPSNSILPGEGSSIRRRQYIIELSNYYSKQIQKGNEEPVIQEHGCVFFDKEDWDDHEWNMFYSLMINAIMYYLENGLVYCEPVNVGLNRLTQSTSEEFVEWCIDKNLELDLKYKTTELFTDFRDTYYGEDSNFKQRTFTMQLKDFAEYKGWEHHITRSNGDQIFWFTVA